MYRSGPCEQYKIQLSIHFKLILVVCAFCQIANANKLTLRRNLSNQIAKLLTQFCEVIRGYEITSVILSIIKKNTTGICDNTTLHKRYERSSSSLRSVCKSEYITCALILQVLRHRSHFSLGDIMANRLEPYH